jgi:hypothetical protein
MSTFEALKIAYCKSFALEEPQTVAVLCFGALSGSIGATSVYREFATAVLGVSPNSFAPFLRSHQPPSDSITSLGFSRPSPSLHRFQGRPRPDIATGRLVRSLQGVDPDVGQGRARRVHQLRGESADAWQTRGCASVSLIGALFAGLRTLETIFTSLLRATQRCHHQPSRVPHPFSSSRRAYNEQSTRSKSEEHDCISPNRL